MAWLGLDRVFLGVDLDEQQRLADQANAETAQWQQQAHDSGRLTDAQYNTAQQNLAAQVAANSDVVGQVDQQFVEGAEEGFQNVLAAPGRVVGFAGDTAGTLVWGILKNIPWWLYIGGFIALFFYLGGGMLLRRELARRMS